MPNEGGIAACMVAVSSVTTVTPCTVKLTPAGMVTLCESALYKVITPVALVAS